MVQFDNGSEKASIAFNICDHAKRVHPDGKRDFANLLVGQDKYKHLTSDNIEDVHVSFLDEKNPGLGLQLTYLNSQYKCAGGKEYQFVVKATCDSEAEDSVAIFDPKSLSDECSPVVILTSADACPAFSLRPLWEFSQKYGEVFAIFFMMLGAYLMIYGGRKYEFTMFTAALFAVGLVTFMLFFMFVMPPNSPEWTIWLCIIICLFTGSSAGSFVKKRARSGVIFIGALLGVFVGFALYNALIYQICEENPLLGLWLTLMFSCIGVAMLCVYFFDHAVIIGSAVIGSYFFFRGLSSYLGGWPNEFVLYQNYTNGKMSEMPVSFYVYGSIMVVTAAASFAMQTNLRKNNAGEYNYRPKDYNYRNA